MWSQRARPGARGRTMEGGVSGGSAEVLPPARRAPHSPWPVWRYLQLHGHDLAGIASHVRTGSPTRS